MIYILTGKIRTGKTTALLDWVSNKNNVDGLLCPDDDKGKRYFLKIRAKEFFKLEAENKNEELIEIGNFKFLKSAFKKANDYLISIASNTEALEENRYIIIDELGKLELKNEGLHVSSEALISKFESSETQHVILVVRDYLVDVVLEHYGISKYSILILEDLDKLQ